MGGSNIGSDGVGLAVAGSNVKSHGVDLDVAGSDVRSDGVEPGCSGFRCRKRWPKNWLGGMFGTR